MVWLYFLWRNVSAVARGLDVSVILELYRLLIVQALSAEWPLSVEPNPEVKSSAKVHGSRYYGRATMKDAISFAFGTDPSGTHTEQIHKLNLESF